MKKKEYRRQKSRIGPLFEEWAERLRLHNFAIVVTYYDNRKQFRKEAKASKNAVMSVTPDWRYLTADIRVCVPMVVSLDEEKLERFVIHELLHVALNHAFGWRLDRSMDEIANEEHVVSHLTTVLYELVDKGKEK